MNIYCSNACFGEFIKLSSVSCSFNLSTLVKNVSSKHALFSCSGSLATLVQLGLLNLDTNKFCQFENLTMVQLNHVSIFFRPTW